MADYIGEATKNDSDVATDWTRLSPQQHIVAVRRFLRRLAGSTPSPTKTFLPVNQQISLSKRPADRKFNDDDDEEDDDDKRLRPVVAESTEDSHKRHQLYSVLKSWGYEHHRSYPIKQADRTMKNYHLFVNRHSNIVGTYEHPNMAWTSKINQHSGHQVQGVGKVELDKHLTSRAARNKHLPEQRSIGATPLAEGLNRSDGAERVRRYSEWMKDNPIRSLDHETGCETYASNLRDSLVDVWRMKSDYEKSAGFDEDTDYRAGSHAQLSDRKKK